LYHFDTYYFPVCDSCAKSQTKLIVHTMVIVFLFWRWSIPPFNYDKRSTCSVKRKVYFKQQLQSKCLSEWVRCSRHYRSHYVCQPKSRTKERENTLVYKSLSWWFRYSSIMAERNSVSDLHFAFSTWMASSGDILSLRLTRYIYYS
jgi:hypothetical protein